MEDTERMEVGRALPAVAIHGAMEGVEAQSLQQNLGSQVPGVLGHGSFPPAKNVDLASRVVFKGNFAASPKGQATPAP